LAIIILHAITGVCTPACLLAASISVEAVTPPLVGLALKELLLFWLGSDGKSNAGWHGHGSHDCPGGPLVIVIGADVMDFVGSVTEVAVTVTVPPVGAVPGAW